jgi:23S rRNA (pseudouridine1915-N3)-methyltransferase
MIKKIKIISVGRVKEKYIRDGIEEYLKRLRPYCKLEIIELKDEGVEKEAERIEKYLDDNTFILDEAGKEMNSKEFSNLFKDGAITFVVGGPEGVSKKLKGKRISLSKMTFTHEMARLFLLEQIYRSYMIITDRKYHR